VFAKCLAEGLVCGDPGRLTESGSTLEVCSRRCAIQNTLTYLLNQSLALALAFALGLKSLALVLIPVIFDFQLLTLHVGLEWSGVLGLGLGTSVLGLGLDTFKSLALALWHPSLALSPKSLLISLENYYTDIVKCLNKTSHQCIPSVAADVKKEWWCPELTSMHGYNYPVVINWAVSERLRCRYYCAGKCQIV